MKPKLLIAVDWYVPAFKAGGPIQSVKNLVSHLNKFYEILILTSDRDLEDTEAMQDIVINKWVGMNQYKVIYLSPKKQTFKIFQEIIYQEQPQFIYLNSLFSIKFTLLPLWSALRYKNAKIILAPRGMLGEGALAIKSFKKKLLIRLLKKSGISNKITWHATSQFEKKEIQKNFGRTQVVIANNLSSMTPKMPVEKYKNVNQLNLFFVSRIAVKKNLLGALMILAKVKSELKIKFTIIGPIDEVEYWEACQKIIQDMPKHIEVEIKGAIPNFLLAEELKNEHALFLPTRHENYGHVIMEALQQSCPVIISDQTPWRNLQEIKIGWDIPLEDDSAYTAAIEKLARMSQIEYNHYSQNAWEYSKKRSQDKNILKAYREIFS